MVGMGSGPTCQRSFWTHSYSTLQRSLTQVFPKQLLLAQLPPEVDILCTHPMFGPDSGRGSWAGLNLMYEVVRCGDDPRRKARVESFLKVRWGVPRVQGGWGGGLTRGGGCAVMCRRGRQWAGCVSGQIQGYPFASTTVVS
jgi:hypothetical protein